MGSIPLFKELGAGIVANSVWKDRHRRHFISEFNTHEPKTVRSWQNTQEIPRMNAAQDTPVGQQEQAPRAEQDTQAVPATTEIPVEGPEHHANPKVPQQCGSLVS